MIKLIPLIYLKNGKAVSPAKTGTPWFQEDALELARYFSSQGAEALYLNDLNIPTAGKGDNFSVIQAIQKDLKLNLWVTGNFRSLAAIEGYAESGIDKIVMGANAYQDPNLLKQATEKFPSKIAVLIEVKNKHVVVPGLIAPTHKTALDYASRFEEDGVAALCYSDTNAQGLLGEENFNAIQKFCVRTKVPVLAMSDIPVMQDLKKLYDFESAGLTGIVIGKPLYENRLDLHSSISFLNDLAAATTQEKTLSPG